MTCKRLLILLLSLAGIAGSAQSIIVKPGDPHIHYSGRVIMHGDTAGLIWPCTSVQVNFKGTGIKATMKDASGYNYYVVIVDGKVVRTIHPDTNKREYVLASGLTPFRHNLELFKRSEWGAGPTSLYQFILDENTRLLPLKKPKKHKIEFFGDSITCGYAIEDTSGKDRGQSEFENAYLSYASITARHFDAEFYNTSRRSIGIMVSWNGMTMPEMYGRLNPFDEKSKWDFSKFIPDIVVINLFQNDSWLVNLPDNNQFKRRFGDKPPGQEYIIKAYMDFMTAIRSKYPKADIICVLGNTDAVKPGSPWPGYIEKAVAQLNDKKIYTHFFPYNNSSIHPGVKEHQAMATDLIAFIDQHIKW